MLHIIKTETQYFNDIVKGTKRSTVRIDDRTPKYAPQDLLYNQEVDLNGQLTGRFVLLRITYKLTEFKGLSEGYCMLCYEVLKL